jgi:hypothetical protein
MSKVRTSTRRSFLRGGTLLAAPMAAGSVAAAALVDDRLKARVERLENEAAIRELHQSWLRRVNAGEHDALIDDSVRRITADHAGAPEKIEVDADGQNAVGYFEYTIESETPLAEDCTLAQMAHAQGDGALRRSERRKLTVNYARTGGLWRIAKVVSTAV